MMLRGRTRRLATTLLELKIPRRRMMRLLLTRKATRQVPLHLRAKPRLLPRTKVALKMLSSSLSRLPL